jgi:LPXTG-motif cell wall-anchored protein
LFRLETEKQVKENVSFYNTGPEQVPGLIVMRLTDKENLDPVYDEIVVLFNARPDSVTFTSPDFTGHGYTLHAVQQASSDALSRASTFDSASGTFTVAGRTTAVFNILHEQPAAATPTPAQEAPASTNNNSFTWLGVAGILLAIGAVVFAWTRRNRK